MMGAPPGFDALRRACVESPDVSPRLHIASAIPVAVICCHDPAPFAVFQIETAWDWQSVEAAALRRRPFVSSANATSTLATPVGSERSTHVSPRSDERKRRAPATSAHTTVPDGALSCAMLGRVIGDGDGDAVGVGDGAAVVAVAVGEGVGEAPAFGWVVHAVRTRTRRSSARMRPASHVLGTEASDVAGGTRTIAL